MLCVVVNIIPPRNYGWGGTCFSMDTLGRRNERHHGDLVVLSVLTVFRFEQSKIKVLFWILRLRLPSLGTTLSILYISTLNGSDTLFSCLSKQISPYYSSLTYSDCTFTPKAVEDAESQNSSKRNAVQTIYIAVIARHVNRLNVPSRSSIHSDWSSGRLQINR